MLGPAGASLRSPCRPWPSPVDAVMSAVLGSVGTTSMKVSTSCHLWRGCGSNQFLAKPRVVVHDPGLLCSSLAEGYGGQWRDDVRDDVDVAREWLEVAKAAMSATNLLQELLGPHAFAFAVVSNCFSALLKSW